MPRRSRSWTTRSTSSSAGPRSTTSAIRCRPWPRWCGRVGSGVASCCPTSSRRRAEERDAFDQLHQLIDPSHSRAFLEEELGTVLPDTLPLTYGATTTSRLPIDIALTEQSDSDTVLATLRAEIDGGPSTGFDPAEEDGKLVVSFMTCVVHGTRT